jgi:hypothetical protein
LIVPRFACNLGNVVQESILATKYTYGIFTTGLIGKKKGNGFKKRNLDTAFHCQQVRCYFLPVLRDIIIALSNNNNNGGNATTTTNSTSNSEADLINNAQMPRKKTSTWWGKI